MGVSDCRFQIADLVQDSALSVGCCSFQHQVQRHPVNLQFESHSAIARSGTSKSALLPLLGLRLAKCSAVRRSFRAAKAWQWTSPRGFLSRTMMAMVALSPVKNSIN